MACKTHTCLFLRGELFIADASESCDLSGLSCDEGLVFKKLGNISSVDVIFETTIIGKENEFIKSDDSCPRVPIISTNLTINLTSAHKQNLLMALYGSNVEPEQGSKVDSACVSSLDKCDFFPFSKKKADPESIEVSLLDIDQEVVSTLFEGTDYKVNKSGIEILRDDIDLTNVDSISISYDFDTTGYNEIDFGSSKQGYKKLYFKGTNYAQKDNALFDVIFHKVLLKPVESLSLISTSEFVSFPLQGVAENVKGSPLKLIQQEE